MTLAEAIQTGAIERDWKPMTATTQRIVQGTKVNIGSKDNLPTVDQIRQALKERKPVVTELYLLLVYENQTAQEKQEGSVREDNGVGFNGADAAFATSLVESMRKGPGSGDVTLGMGRKVKRLLTINQREAAGKLLVKYARQIHKRMEEYAAKPK